MATQRTGAVAAARKTIRKKLRTPEARDDDVVQVCFETTDQVWDGIRSCRPPVLELQEFVTKVLEQALPRLDDTRPVTKPPAYSLEGRATKVRCFKTPRKVWAHLIWWAAIGGSEIKELVSGVLWEYVREHGKDGRRGR
jgi:hypothetical protein